MKLKSQNNKKIVLAFITIFLTLININFILADRVGVIVNFPDGSTHGRCIESFEGESGYDLMQKISLPTLWAGPGSFGHMLCKINNIGQEPAGDFCEFVGGKFWSFYKKENNKFEPLPVGFDGGSGCWNNDFNSFNGHYCVKDKDVLGFKFIEYGDSPPTLYSFEQICDPLELTDVKVYVNGKKQKDTDEEGGTIEAAPGSEILFKIEIENNHLFDEIKSEDVKAEIIVKDINNNRDIEKKLKFKSLGPGENDEDSLSFTIPTILEDDEYDLELKITAESSIGEQLTTINYDIEIDRKKHNLIFSKLELKNLESCPNDLNLLNMEITNIGEKDEDAILKVKGPELNLDFSDSFSLESGEKNSIYKKELGFKIPNINSGDYNIDINLDYSENLKEQITLTIKNCDKTAQITNTLSQSSEKNQIKLGIKKAIPQKQTYYQRSFIEVYSVPILLGVFLAFLISSLILIMLILNK